MSTAPLRVGMIGLGTIGQAVVRLAREQENGAVAIIGAVVRDPARARPGVEVPIVPSLNALLALRPDVIVEVCGHAGLKEHGPQALRAGCDLIMVSVGVFAEPGVMETMVAAAEAGRAQATIASGAIGALDAIAAAAVGGLTRVTHTTRKPARTLLRAEDAAALSEAKEVFRGSVREGALLFPESINVAAAVSLAGIGLDRTEVCVLADPAIERNMHTVVAEGAFGRLQFEIQGIPTEENPRTGRLVAMSVMRTLLLRRAPIVVG
ncbi:MAG: aspartate dehydrogenase [Thermomicrobia bacterium]|nr:aspartate dehydrogenase [Thermomicrobia bacterium]